MFYVFTKKVYPEKSELLFADNFTSKDITENWEITGGEWSAGKGYLEGLYRENGGGLIYSNRHFPGDTMLDFYGRLVPPCDNDLNFTFRAKGWDTVRNDADTGYIAGLNGWWTLRSGIERYPECRLQALTSAFKAESGREYHIQAGIIEDRCFIAVDGNVIIELRDPDPINAPDCCRVGLGAYASHIIIRDFKLYKPFYVDEAMAYEETL